MAEPVVQTFPLCMELGAESAHAPALLPRATLEYTVLVKQGRGKQPRVEHSIQAGYLRLQPRAKVASSQQFDEQIVLDLSEDGRIVGVEMLTPLPPSRLPEFKRYLEERVQKLDRRVNKAGFQDFVVAVLAPTTIARFWSDAGHLVDAALHAAVKTAQAYMRQTGAAFEPNLAAIVAKSLTAPREPAPMQHWETRQPEFAQVLAG